MYIRNAEDPESSEVSLINGAVTGFTWIKRSGTSLNVVVNRSNVLGSAADA